MKEKKVLLAGDLGATNLRLALFTESSGQYRTEFEKKYAVKNHTSFENIIKLFIKDLPYNIMAASFAVAGPVLGSKVNITNLNWKLEKESLKEILSGVPISLINDLTGMSSSIPLLKSEDLIEIHPGEPIEKTTIALIAPGTGLGEGYLNWVDGQYVAFNSEGGNSDFAAKNDLEYGLLKFLQKKYGYVSNERVCSGLAIPDIYRYLKKNGKYKESTTMSQCLISQQDPTAEIVGAAMTPDNPDPLSYQTMKLFVQILGAEAGNLALKLMATGGVYIGGGIPPRIIPLIKKYFMKSFLAKGRYQYIMESIPVKVIIHPQPALLGAARYGFINLFEN